MIRWLEAREYVFRSPTLPGRAWRLVLVTLVALLGAIVMGPVRWVTGRLRRRVGGPIGGRGRSRRG